jgi:hypothetical protein
MSLINCGGCDTVLESTLRACPNCGRCPGCGKKRVDDGLLQKKWTCAACEAPYCTGCGRCHACGQLRLFDVEACECGHPGDPERLAKTEKAYRLGRRWFDLS